MQNNNERICLLGKYLKMSISESFRLKLKFFFLQYGTHLIKKKLYLMSR